MTRAFLALSLWCLCAVVGLQATRMSAENAEKGQHLEEKREALLWEEEVNSVLNIEVEQGRDRDRARTDDKTDRTVKES